jgi:hypothetical protein
VGSGIVAITKFIQNHKQLWQQIKKYNITLWAAGFETPCGGSTFFSFFFFLGSIGRNKQ